LTPKTISQIRKGQISKSLSIERTPFIFLDIETTGLHPEKGAVVTEIAMLNRYNQFYHWKFVKNHNEQLAVALEHIMSQLTAGVVVGHNVGFDLGFLAYKSDLFKGRGPNVWFVDTLGLSKKYCKGISDFKLSSLLQYFDITVNGQLHTAVVDAEAVRALFWKLISIGNVESLNQAKVKRLNWSTF